VISFDHRDTSKKTGEHPWYDQTVEQIPEQDIQIVSLKYGDVQWMGLDGTQHVLEIKHTGDFIRSFGDRHIQEQVENMAEAAELVDEVQNHLLITGFLSSNDDGYTITDEQSWNYPYSIWGPYLMGVQSLGFIVHRCELKDFGRYFASIFKTTQRKRSRVSRRRKLSLVTKQAQALRALAPAISIPVLEKGIKEQGFFYFVNPGAEVKDFAAIDGIGPVGANELHEAINRI
jgi:ERCC4-type nuclease